MWVHPSDGIDPATLALGATYVNDPSQKFRTLQTAIDVLQVYLAKEYDPVDNVNQQGIVYALPGTYGPAVNGPASGDTLPIRMRDRVHVQGLGARRCTIRGAGNSTQAAPNRTVTWPTQSAASLPASVEVLVSYEVATVDNLDPVYNLPLPWFDGQQPHWHTDDNVETLDGFTFQGGDVQVLLSYGTGLGGGANFFPGSRISNCIFDMRHMLLLETPAAGSLTGPYFGIMMERPSTVDNAVSPANVGYLDNRTLIAHNTFVFAHWTGQESNGGWASESRNSAVGIIDFTQTNCSSTLVDGNDTHRGVGNSCIVSNLFRTRPLPAGTTARPFAMLGIGREDTQVLSGGSYVDTNAFDPARVGSTNGTFHSVPVQSFIASVNSTTWVHWNCQLTPNLSPCNSTTGNTPPCTNISPLPTPKVAIWDTVAGVDPGFVGEYVVSEISTPTVDSGYVDWRIMPGSPLENQSVSPVVGGPRGFETQPHAGDDKWLFFTDAPAECALFRWDGEHWGNPRIADGAPDIGFDERGLVIQAGNWANGSNSHNQPGFLQPTGVGSPTRWFILPTTAGGVNLYAANRYLRFHDTTQVPVGGVPGNAWVNPPATLANPPFLGSLPVGYRTKYVSFATIPWAPISLTGSAAPWLPLGGGTGQPQLWSIVVSELDDECLGGSCAHLYFNVQGVIVDNPAWPGSPTPAEILRGNLQSEYR